MTGEELAFFERTHRRISSLEGDVTSTIAIALAALAAGMPIATLERLIASGGAEAVIAALFSGKSTPLTKAITPIRKQLRATMARSFELSMRDLPDPSHARTVGVFFDTLNPRVIEAIRDLETEILGTLSSGVRETVRAAVTRGLQNGWNSRKTATHLHDVIPLPPRLEDAVANFRGLLEIGDREALTRELRDVRFDAYLDRVLGTAEAIPVEKIDRMVAAYAKRAVAYHAETLSTTATLDSYKLAHGEAWASAIDRGIVDADSLLFQWIGIEDGRQRPEHKRMTGAYRRSGQPYSNGDSFAGEQDPHRCRCLDMPILVTPHEAALLLAA